MLKDLPEGPAFWPSPGGDLLQGRPSDLHPLGRPLDVTAECVGAPTFGRVKAPRDTQRLLLSDETNKVILFKNDGSYF